MASALAPRRAAHDQFARQQDFAAADWGEPCSRSIRQRAASRPSASVGWAMVVSPGPTSGAHSSFVEADETDVGAETLAPAASLRWRQRKVTTALPDRMAHSSPACAGAKRLCDGLFQRIGAVLHCFRNTAVRALNRDGASGQAWKEAWRSRRELTFATGSLTYSSSRYPASTSGAQPPSNRACIVERHEIGAHAGHGGGPPACPACRAARLRARHLPARHGRRCSG